MNRGINNMSYGFTLVEILVATIIFAIIMIAVFSSFQGFVISGRAIGRRTAMNNITQTIYTRIASDLESIFITQPPRFSPPEFHGSHDPYRLYSIQEPAGNSIFSAVQFASLAHIPCGTDKRNGVAQISYYIRKNSDDTYDLVRSDHLPPFPDKVKSCTDPVLCRNISGFDIIYTDNSGKKYNTWDSDDKEFEFGFPCTMEFKIRLGRGSHNRMLDIIIPIMAERIIHEPDHP